MKQYSCASSLIGLRSILHIIIFSIAMKVSKFEFWFIILLVSFLDWKSACYIRKIVIMECYEKNYTYVFLTLIESKTVNIY